MTSKNDRLIDEVLDGAVLVGVTVAAYEGPSGDIINVFGDEGEKIYLVKVIEYGSPYGCDAVLGFYVFADNCYRAMELMDTYLARIAHNLAFHAFSAQCVGAVVRNG